jgi:hypothetical protein
METRTRTRSACNGNPHCTVHPTLSRSKVQSGEVVARAIASPCDFDEERERERERERKRKRERERERERER